MEKLSRAFFLARYRCHKTRAVNYSLGASRLLIGRFAGRFNFCPITVYITISFQ